MPRLLPPCEGVFPTSNGPHQVGPTDPEVGPPRVQFNRLSGGGDGTSRGGEVEGFAPLTGHQRFRKEGPSGRVIWLALDELFGEACRLLPTSSIKGFECIEVDLLAHA